MADRFRIEILPGGLVKISTDRISAANHLSADRLVRGLEEDLGGDVCIEKRGQRLLFDEEADGAREHELE